MIKQLILVLVFMFLIFSCKTSKQQNQLDLKINRLVFHKTYLIPNENIDALFTPINLDSVKIFPDDIKIKTKEDSLIAKQYNEIGTREILKKMLQDTIKVIMEVHDDYYFLPEIIQDRAFDFGRRVYKDSLVQVLSRREKLTGNNFKKINFLKQDDYTFDYQMRNTKVISGFKCFKVIASNKENSIVHSMYVTESIQLDYNPIIQIEDFIGKYYVLELHTINKSNKLIEAYSKLESVVGY